MKPVTDTPKNAPIFNVLLSRLSELIRTEQFDKAASILTELGSYDECGEVLAFGRAGLAAAAAERNGDLPGAEQHLRQFLDQFPNCSAPGRALALHRLGGLLRAMERQDEADEANSEAGRLVGLPTPGEIADVCRSFDLNAEANMMCTESSSSESSQSDKNCANNR